LRERHIVERRVGIEAPNTLPFVAIAGDDFVWVAVGISDEVMDGVVGLLDGTENAALETLRDF